MKSGLTWAIIFVGFIGVAVALRVPALSLRPMHHDEANQAVKFGILQETGQYRYDLTDHHGPTLYYITLPFARLTAGKDFSATTEATFRMVPVFFGIGTILLLLLFRNGLGRNAVLASAALTAVSPAMVYYSRFYIQEMLLVFFTLGAIACCWRYFVARKAGWAVAAGLFFGMMFATKETAVIAYASMAGALFLTYAWDRRNKGCAGAYSGAQEVLTGVFNLRHLAALVLAGGLIAFIFFSSFFTNWQGPVDSIIAYKSYLAKSGGDVHSHPWYHYLQMLAFWKNAPGPVWSEWLILVLVFVGVIPISLGISSSSGGDGRFHRFVLVYTILMTACYSVIPYKTPWCLLSFLSGMILVAGIGVEWLLNVFKGRMTRAILALFLACAGYGLAGKAWATSFNFHADPRNPYVYAHTSRDFMNLVKRVEMLTQVHPRGKGLLVAVIAPPHETWPLPWYLRDFPQSGFWTCAADLPVDIHPDVAVVSADQQDTVVARLGADYHIEYFGLRPDVLLTVLISRDLWDAFIKGGGAAGLEKHKNR